MHAHPLRRAHLVALLQRREDPQVLHVVLVPEPVDAEDHPLLLTEEVREHLQELRDHRVSG
jgi:hypothetical protein